MLFSSTCRHLGYGQRSELPIARGFDTYLGFWNGAETYSTHTVGADVNGNEVFDFVDSTSDGNTTQTAYQFAGQYSTYVFANRAVDIITSAARLAEASGERVPWFLYLAFQSVHWPLEAPAERVAKFKHIPDKNRQLVAAMASIMDDGVGDIIGNLSLVGERNRTICVFTSDNGGPTHGFEGTESNNYP